MRYQLNRSGLVLFLSLIAGLCLGAVLSLDGARIGTSRIASRPVPAAAPR